jgi:hypothetical protein
MTRPVPQANLYTAGQDKKKRKVMMEAMMEARRARRPRHFSLEAIATDAPE